MKKTTLLMSSLAVSLPVSLIAAAFLIPFLWQFGGVMTIPASSDFFSIWVVIISLIALFAVPLFFLLKWVLDIERRAMERPVEQDILRGPAVDRTFFRASLYVLVMLPAMVGSVVHGILLRICIVGFQNIVGPGACFMNIGDIAPFFLWAAAFISILLFRSWRATFWKGRYSDMQYADAVVFGVLSLSIAFTLLAGVLGIIMLLVSFD